MCKQEAPADGPEEGLKEEEAEDLDNNKAEAKDEEGEEEKKEDGGADEVSDFCLFFFCLEILCHEQLWTMNDVCVMPS